MRTKSQQKRSQINPPLKPITVVNQSNGTSCNIGTVVGLDESAGPDAQVFVAVRSPRCADIRLVRTMVNNDLYPFKYKSHTSVANGPLTPKDRQKNIKSLIKDMEKLPLSLGSVVIDSNASPQQKSAAAVMAAKKSITNCLERNIDLADRAVLIHDGDLDSRQQYANSLWRQMESTFDQGFREGLCDVSLTLQTQADFIFPQNIVADYIAGYLRDRGSSVEEIGKLWDPVDTFDPSWSDPAENTAQSYDLDILNTDAPGCRFTAWAKGGGLPKGPSSPPGVPPSEIVDQIEDKTVQRYLNNL